jgi:hypothetical protein
MIISHKYQFIFIKTMKTAGTSLEFFLGQHCGPNDIVTPFGPSQAPVAPHQPRNHKDFFNHIAGGDVRKIVGENVWERYFKFCVERNPWDKTLSYWHMLNARRGGKLSFEDYLSTGDFCLNYPQYTSPLNNEEIIVDRVLRYEQLNEELTHMMTMFDIPFDGTLEIRAKSHYRLDRRPYQEIYTPEQAMLIEKAFDKEIRIFGYSF